MIAIPSSPSAPLSIEFTQVNIVAVNTSPFTGQQQVQDWQGAYMEANVTMPALSDAQAQDWVAFLRALKGQRNVFQFSAAFASAFPASVSDGASPAGQRYWRLKTNAAKWSISLAKIYGIQFECREAL